MPAIWTLLLHSIQDTVCTQWGTHSGPSPNFHWYHHTSEYFKHWNASQFQLTQPDLTVHITCLSLHLRVSCKSLPSHKALYGLQSILRTEKGCIIMVIFSPFSLTGINEQTPGMGTLNDTFSTSFKTIRAWLCWTSQMRIVWLYVAGYIFLCSQLLFSV